MLIKVRFPGGELNQPGPGRRKSLFPSGSVKAGKSSLLSSTRREGACNLTVFCAVNIYELKARLWLWWPFITIGLVVLAVFVLVRQHFEVEPVVGEGAAPQRDLTLLVDLRAAYLEANGGEVLLRGLQTIQLRGTLESGGQELPFLQIKKRPDQSLLTLMFEQYNLSFGVDGAEVWRRVTVEGREPEYQRVEAELADGIRKMGEFFNPVLQVLLSEGIAVEKISWAEWEGHPVIAMEFLKDLEGIRSTAYLDAAQLQLLAVVETLPSGKVRRLVYGDYRKVNGVQEPGMIETFIDGSLNNRVRIERVEHNLGALPILFRYPESSAEAPVADGPVG